MKITIGSDHRGFELKEQLQSDSWQEKGVGPITWDDVGTDTGDERVDYPIFAQRVCAAVRSGAADRGIIICGSGVGAAIAANRFRGIYAALCWSPEVTRMARKHDNINVLVLPADFIAHDEAVAIIQAWIETAFLGGRYQERLEILEKIAKKA